MFVTCNPHGRFYQCARGNWPQVDILQSGIGRREEDAFKVDFKRTRMSKPELRKKLASLGFSEKIKILKKLRRRSLAIAANGLRPSKTKPG
jgi:hypothetical protein